MEIKTVRSVLKLFLIGRGTLRGRLQRDRGLRKVREQAVKWTTEGAGNETESSVFCDVRHASVARDMIVS